VDDDSEWNASTRDKEQRIAFNISNDRWRGCMLHLPSLRAPLTWRGRLDRYHDGPFVVPEWKGGVRASCSQWGAGNWPGNGSNFLAAGKEIDGPDLDAPRFVIDRDAIPAFASFKRTINWPHACNVTTQISLQAWLGKLHACLVISHWICPTRRNQKVDLSKAQDQRARD